MSETRITLNGKEIQNPLARVAIILLFVVVAVLGTAVAVLVSVLHLVIAVIEVIVTLPVHFVLRLTGRRGFIAKSANSYSYKLSASAFERV